MSSSSMPPPAADRRWKPLTAPHCARCGSPNTKFCYYNNYSLSQPRYFCKTCRRYWTMGGCLRNVPVGSGCRKNRRPAPKPMIRPATSPAAFTSSHVHLQVHDASAAGPAIDLAALYAKFSNHCAPPPPPSPPPPQQFGPGFAVAELDSNSGGYLFGEQPNGDDFLGQVMSQQLQHCYSVNGELEFPVDPSGAGGVIGDVSLGVPSPLEFIDTSAASDLDLSVPDLVNEESMYKLALESAPVEGMVFHHHDLYRHW